MVKKILSFDVGISNLAYCKIYFNPDKKDYEQYQIMDWGIIDIKKNLLDNLPNNDDTINNDFVSSYKKMKIKELKKEMENHNLSIDGKKKELIVTCEKFLKKKGILKQIKHFSILEIGKVLFLELNKKKENFFDVDEIVIENQPVLKNPKMKSIQMMLYSFFLLEIVNNGNKNIKNIKLISPRNKLKIYKGKIDKTQFNIKSKYTLTKKLAVLYCEEMIEYDEKNKLFFLKHSKKDDLADSYLQGAYYLSRNKK
jgi:hypothetical protein